MTHPASLDSDLQQMVDRMAANGAPRAFAGTVEEARSRLSRAVLAARQDAQLPVVTEIRNVTIERDGLAIPARIYRSDRKKNCFTIVYFHGGGYALGGLDEFDESARRLCRDTGCNVLAIGYRLAPENPYPAALEDARAAVLWTREHIARFGGRPDRIAVAGESAGGNLAASVALFMRDRDVSLAGQLLIVPGVDFARKLAPDAVFPMLSAADLSDSKRYLFGDSHVHLATFPPSPLHAADHSGLAPAVIAIAGHDPLRSECCAYAGKLLAAGTRVQVLDFPAMNHTFFGLARVSAGADQAASAICSAFRALLIGGARGSKPAKDRMHARMQE